MSAPKVDTPSAGHTEMLEKYTLIDDVYNGTASMLRAGQKYLPQRPMEEDTNYKERLEQSTLLNAVRWAVKTLGSKPFNDPIKIGETTTPELTSFIWDVTGTGETLQIFAQKLFITGLKYGMAHILVEYPEVPPNLSAADEARLNIRPYFVEVDPRSLFAWKFERIGGIEKLVQIRILELASTDSEWGAYHVPQIRVIDVDRVRLYQKTSDSNDEFVMIKEIPRKSPFDFIPLATLYTSYISPMLATPPLEDLAYLNVKHWKKQSNLDYIESAQFPILFGKNLTTDPESKNSILPIGVMMMVHSTEADADLQVVEPEGSSIKHLRDSLILLEDQMSSLSSQLLAKKPGNETATGRAIDSAEATSELQAMARNLEDVLETALEYAGKYMGIKTPNADLELTTEFEDVLTSSDMSDLLSTREAKQISHTTFISESKRRGFLADTISAEDEQKRIVNETTE